MDENSLLIPVAMKIIMNSGNARTKANEALEALSIFDFSNAHKKIVEAREDIKKAHQEQTEIIQKEAAGEHYKTYLLFTHAQDTLMTIFSELNITMSLVGIVKSIEYKVNNSK